VLRQSGRTALYESALRDLEAKGRLRPCHCSRAQLAALPENQARAAGDELFHPEQCLASRATAPPAWRLRTPDGDVEFVDRVQGLQCSNVARTVGDFVLKRRTGSSRISSPWSSTTARRA